MSLHDVPIHIPNSNHFIWQTQIHCHCNSWLVSIDWKYSSPVNEKDKYMHKYGPIPIKFSAILWPCLILELLGPLSLFNCVYISAWAIHNVNIFQCIGRANTYPILLLTESIFAWTIWVRAPDPSLMLTTLSVYIQGLSKLKFSPSGCGGASSRAEPLLSASGPGLGRVWQRTWVMKW